jgi:ribonuclease P protein component
VLPVSKQFTLGKNERLKSRKQIEKLFSEGKSFVVSLFRVYFIINGQWSMVNGLIQFGVGVSSKNFKRSVDRNRIKRLTREAWRLQKNDAIFIRLMDSLQSSNKKLSVFFIYTGKELPDFATVKDQVAVAFRKLSERVNENDPANS